MASEPRFSISPLCFYRLDSALGGACVDRQLSRLDLVFGGALGLDFGGAEDTVFVQFAIRQGLRAILESIGKRLSAGVGDFKPELVLDQDKLDLTADAMDGARFDVPADPQPFAISL